MMSIADKSLLKDSLQGRPLPSISISTNEREIANYPVGRGLKARILFFSGETPITSESIDKLIKLLELNKEDLPDVIADEKEN